jgi:hypothetical protein
MTVFSKLREEFQVNWTIVLIGWEGPAEQPPSVSTEELLAYAEERLGSSSNFSHEDELIVNLMSLDSQRVSRERLRDLLQRLAMSGGNEAIELRKWRVILLKELLKTLSDDPILALISLTDFWASFDFPADSPHIVQGRGNTLSPTEYYQEGNLKTLLERHRTWIANEIATLKQR